jgi:hypothetical protein
VMNEGNVLPITSHLQSGVQSGVRGATSTPQTIVSAKLIASVKKPGYYSDGGNLYLTGES